MGEGVEDEVVPVPVSDLVGEEATPPPRVPSPAEEEKKEEAVPVEVPVQVAKVEEVGGKVLEVKELEVVEDKPIAVGEELVPDTCAPSSAKVA